jgi:hypothetical protein
MNAWKVLGAAVLSFSVGALALPGEAAAGKGPVRKSDVRAKLDPDPCCIAVSPDAEGKATKMTWKRNGVAERHDLKVKVEIPLGTAGLADPTAAEAADVRVVFSNADGAYAECALAFTGVEGEDEDELEAAVAEYKTIVFLRPRRGVPRLHEVHGACDVNLAEDGVQPGMPDVNADDTASVTVNGIEVLGGSFSAKK